MQSKIIKKLKSFLSYSLKLFILTSFLISQSFIAEIFLYQNNPNTKSINTAQANYSDHWYNTNWSYRKPITIHASEVSHTTEASQSNFPVLISLTNPDLKTISHSGKVQNDPNGYDIIFTTQDGSIQLDHEMEKYDPTTGEIVAWVKIPVLSSVSDTTLYIYYGNSAINATQEHKNNVWNDGTGNHFKGVWHMNQDPSGTALQMKDSAQYANDGMTYGLMTSGQSVVGRIGNATSFDGSNDYVSTPSMQSSSAGSVSMWVSPHFNQVGDNRLQTLFWTSSSGSGTPRDQLNTIIIDKLNTAGGGDSLFFRVNSGTNTSNYVAGTSWFVQNQWIMITMSWDSNNFYIYKNGVLVKTQAYTGTISFNAPVNIGRDRQFYFDGTLDEFRISDTTRSADWIKTEYNNESNPNFFYTLGAEEDTMPPVLAQITPVPTPTNNATPFYTFSSTKSGIIIYSGDCSSATTSAVSGNNTVAFNLLSSGIHSNCAITIRDGLDGLSNTLAVTTFTVNNVLTTYVVPAITDNKILPKSSISSSYLGETISTQMSPGEYKAASFAVNSNVGVSSLQVEVSNLTGNGNAILSSAVDIKTVKCWYQGGYDNSGVSVVGRYLTPELLLKDDSLINVDGDSWNQWNISNPNSKNYLKVDGSYIDISSDTPQRSQLYPISISDRSVQDAATLQPINLPANYNKQFWITLHVPDNTTPDNYRGTISLKNGAQTIKALNINVQVLPITLPQPSIEYSIYYRGTIRNTGSISSEDKTVEQYTAEQQDMREHGITNPTIYPFGTDDNLLQELSVRQQAGMDNTNMYYIGGISTNNISYYKNLTVPYGVVNLYQYGPDEHPIDRNQINNEHDAGGRHFNAEYVSSYYADSVADILDLLIAGGVWPSVADKYHTYGYKIFLYNSPQVVPEYPLVFRRNYGLTLWQNNYDGAMDYAYQHSSGDIWNDFDNSMRDHVFAYPTMDGVVDTIQWEGFREGINDMRYLAALQDAISVAKSQGGDTTATEAENYLLNLKNSDLVSQDLDAVRSQIIDYILALASSTHSLTTNHGTGSGFYTKDSNVIITANIPQADMVFNKWIGDTQYIANENAASTTVAMPSHAISLTATYTNSLWYDNTFSYRKNIIIDHTKVSNVDQSNFPVLISLIDPSLKNIANGGKVQNLSGYDIYFTLPDATLLSYEIESYDNTTGKLVAWVKLPTISVSQDTFLYMYYGNPDIASSQENTNSSWDTNFKGVWHLGDTPSGHAVGDYKDSTINANNSTNTTNEPMSTSGQIDGAQSFNGSNSNISMGVGNVQSFTLSFWEKSGTGRPVFMDNATTFNVGFHFWGNSAPSGSILTRVGDGSNSVNMTTSGLSWGNSGWHNIILIADRNANLQKLYFDGQLKNSIDISAVTGSISMSGLKLGYGSGNLQYFNGSLDEVRISDTARSADWIKTEYNNQSSPSTFSTLSSEENLLPPTITSLSANLPNGTYGTGTTIPITINFSKDVTSTGNITLTLNTIPQRSCSFTVTNNNSAICNYTIQGGDSATNLNATISGTIHDQFGNPMINFTPTSNLSDSTTININTSSSPFTPPTKPNITTIQSSINNNTNIDPQSIPSNITQIAISLTPDFKGVSWIDFDRKKFSTINQTTQTLYIKLRTNEGAVSDTIIIPPQTSINNTISLIDGDIIQCKSSNDPNAVYIVKIIGNKTYIRHITSIQIFNYYKHLKWENLKQVNSLTPFSLSSWIRVNTNPNGLPKAGDKVYEINGDQTKHWINMTSNQFLTHGGSDEAIYTVNSGELNLYSAGADVVSL